MYISWQYSISKTHSTSSDNSSLLIKVYSFFLLSVYKASLDWTWCRLSSFKFTWSYVVKSSISHPDVEFSKTAICTALHTTAVWSSWHSNDTGRKLYFLYKLVQLNLQTCTILHIKKSILAEKQTTSYPLQLPTSAYDITESKLFYYTFLSHLNFFPLGGKYTFALWCIQLDH